MKRAFLGCIIVVVTGACGEAPTSPAAAPADLAFNQSARSLVMLDQCDPASFNAVLGAGTCTGRNGGLTVDQFVAQLEDHGTVNSWRFNPAKINVPSTTTLDVVNHGGEAHTFTEVAQFGGGFIPFLNALTGNFVPAPECVNAANPTLPNPNLVFVPPGGHDMVTVTPGVATKYMCCIHPWMRAETM